MIWYVYTLRVVLQLLIQLRLNVTERNARKSKMIASTAHFSTTNIGLNRAGAIRPQPVIIIMVRLIKMLYLYTHIG